jgi:Mce-associated membrane protein
VEDQPADRGALAAAGPVPQGKAARTRHRLPRQKLRQEGRDDPAAEVHAEEVAESEPVVDSDAGDTAEPESEVVDAETPVEPTPARRRFPWRRSKPAGDPVADSVEPTDSEHESSTETTASDGGDAPSAEVSDEEPEAETVLVPHRTAGRALKIAAIVAAALFVGAAAFAGSTVQPYLTDRATVHTKFEVADTAAKAITTLWTYTPDDMDSLPDRASKFLAGDFATEYRRYIDAIVESNKQAQVTNNTQVLGAAVESLTPTEASAIVYTNSVATSPVTKGIPSLRYLAYRLTMELRNRQWLITKMTAVTSLDLTPKL